MGELITFLTAVLQAHGLLAVIEILEAVLIVYLFRQIRGKDQQLIEQSEKRLEDVVEEREKYQELASDIEKSIDLLIKVLKKNGN